GEVRRDGDGSALRVDRGRGHSQGWLLLCVARGTCRNRDIADPAFWHGRTETPIPSEAGEGRDDRSLLPERGSRRLGCTGRQGPRRSEPRWVPLCSERAEDVDYQR